MRLFWIMMIGLMLGGLGSCQMFDGGGEEGEPLLVVSYNVWYGFSKNKDKKAAYLEWMKVQAPDLVALQELNHYTEVKLANDARAWGHQHSVLLKREGFPTGLTSSRPITKVKRTLEGFHHGLLRAETHGLIVYVIHLHPSNYAFRQKEIDLILKDIDSLPAKDRERVMLIGDFNTFSNADAKYYEAHGELEPFFAERDVKYKEKNLEGGKLDYSVIDKMLDAGFVDVTVEHRDEAAGKDYQGSFPTPLRAHENHGNGRRLDYVFVSPSMGLKCVDARVVRDEQTDMFSDHYPVVAWFVGVDEHAGGEMDDLETK